MTGDRSTFPVEPGEYRVWLHPGDAPITLHWSGIPAYPGAMPSWRWGAMRVSVWKWQGPIGSGE